MLLFRIVTDPLRGDIFFSGIHEEIPVRNYIIITGAIFTLVALAHVLRLVFDWPIQIADVPVPLWVSWIAVIVPASIAIWAAIIFRQVEGDIIRFKRQS